MKKKLLTVEDLFLFCKKNGLQTFSSKDTGYKLAVQMPATFEVQDNADDPHRGMMKLKFKIFHEGLNRNGSNISHAAAMEIAKTIPNRPVLAYIHEIGEGTNDWDFAAHEVEYSIGTDGDPVVEYIERQVGAFSEEPAFWEHDDEVDKDFVCAYAYIPEDYTMAADIIRSKGGTKNSCELIVEEMNYNVKDDYLDLIHCYLNGSTLLGRDDSGTPIGEGMLGSRADIVEFSADNNSVMFNNQELLVEMKKLNTLLSTFNDKYPMGKEEDRGPMNEQFVIDTLAKYGKTVEDIDFEYKEMSEEEFTAKCAELFDEAAAENPENVGEPVGEPQPENDPEPVADPEPETGAEPTPETGSEPTPDPEEPEQAEPVENFVLKYELSHDDIRSQIYEALWKLDQANDYRTDYMIAQVYDDYFIYSDWSKSNNEFYKQSYTKGETEITFNGDPVVVYAEFLTADEKGALELMRSTYDELKEFKSNIESQELHAQREEVLNSDDYSVLAEDEAFAELVANMDNYSVEELQNKADLIFAAYIKKAGSFSRKEKAAETEPKKNILHFGSKDNTSNKNQEAYPGLFND